MAFGVPGTPPHPTADYAYSQDDESCPDCGWSVREAVLDHNAAHNAGLLHAVEIAEQSPFMSMSGTTPIALYWCCGNCRALFVTEEDISTGAMT